MNQYHRFFIQKNTELGSPPLVPEIKLHLAVDATELWKMTTKELKDNGLPLPFWAFAWAGGQALASPGERQPSDGSDQGFCPLANGRRPRRSDRSGFEGRPRAYVDLRNAHAGRSRIERRQSCSAKRHHCHTA